MRDAPQEARGTVMDTRPQSLPTECSNARSVIMDRMKKIGPISFGVSQISQYQWREIFRDQHKVHLALRHIRSCSNCQDTFSSEAKVAKESMLWLVRNYLNQSLAFDHLDGLSVEDIFSDLLAAE